MGGSVILVWHEQLQSRARDSLPFFIRLRNQVVQGEFAQIWLVACAEAFVRSSSVLSV